jgi:hypothetical protein
MFTGSKPTLGFNDKVVIGLLANLMIKRAVKLVATIHDHQGITNTIGPAEMCRAIKMSMLTDQINYGSQSILNMYELHMEQDPELFTMPEWIKLAHQAPCLQNTDGSAHEMSMVVMKQVFEEDEMVAFEGNENCSTTADCSCPWCLQWETVDQSYAASSWPDHPLLTAVRGSIVKMERGCL